jgi:serine/threonine-protein kinase
VTAAEDAHLGLELAGQIRLTHLLGVGSMGRVYRAWQEGIGRSVAVKILHHELNGNADLVKRFHCEAKVASRLVHPNVVQVLMTGELPLRGEPGSGGELYLVMEHLDGVSLLSLLAASGKGQALPLARALRIVLQICDAVGEAHAQSIVHRDLKPENVMLIQRGDDADFAKVLDFGIARLDWGDRSMATQAGLIFGTAKYISPEGAEGRAVSAAADVYSIATILYQCLSGRTPFEGDSHVALLVQHAHSPPPELRSIARASYVPAPIASVIMQNLAKDPGERAPDARALGRELLTATRASGLDAETILSSTALGFRDGAMRLASRERTKAMALIAPHPVAASASMAPTHAEPEAPAEPEDSLASLSSPSYSEGAPTHDESAPDLRSAFEERGCDAGDEPPATSDGAAPRPVRRARAARLVAALVLGASAVFAIIAGGRRTGVFSADESVESYLAAGRESLRRHAWDTPSPSNIRELTDRALARFPNEPRLLELRREAAERMVSDSLGRSYAGDRVSALRIARLALELHPQLTSAQHLVADLVVAPELAAEARPAAVEHRAAPSLVAPKKAPVETATPGPSPVEPRPAGAAAEHPLPAPASTAQSTSTAGPATSADLPAKPSPPHTPTTPPAPSSTPWL